MSKETKVKKAKFKTWAIPGTNTVVAQPPKTRVPHVFTVTRTSKNNIIFEGERTCGVIDTSSKKFYYNSRNKNRNDKTNTKERKVNKEFVEPFYAAAKLSEKAERKLASNEKK